MIVLTPSGDRAGLLGAGPRALELTTQGFYELRADEEGVTEIVATNLDPAESDLTPLDPLEVVAAVSGGVGAATGPEEVVLSPADQERRLNLWWYLVLAALVLLAAETLLSNRLARTSG